MFSGVDGYVVCPNGNRVCLEYRRRTARRKRVIAATSATFPVGPVFLLFFARNDTIQTCFAPQRTQPVLIAPAITGYSLLMRSLVADDSPFDFDKEDTNIWVSNDETCAL